MIPKFISALFKSKQYYVEKAEQYMNENDVNTACRTIRKGIIKYPNNPLIREKVLKMTDIFVSQKQLEKACDLLNIYMEQPAYQSLLEIEIRMVMISRLLGKPIVAKRQFDYLLHNHVNKVKQCKQDYHRMVIFDNGKTRIEYYKKLHKTNAVVLTFDSLNITWDHSPFAFKLLMRQDLDIIAVRKSRKLDFFQDLSYSDFETVVKDLLDGYQEKSLYSFSLGAYAALYYAADLVDHMLTISPRQPVHPIYGQKKYIETSPFYHSKQLAYHYHCSPVIVYDPKDKLDSRYVNEGIVPYFPNANLIKIPYGGHKLTRHLLQIGTLKKFVLTFLNDKKMPVYDKHLRGKSSVYLKLIASECMKRNKPKWALTAISEALQIDPSNTSIQKKYKIITEQVKG